MAKPFGYRELTGLIAESLEGWLKMAGNRIVNAGLNPGLIQFLLELIAAEGAGIGDANYVEMISVACAALIL